MLRVRRALGMTQCQLAAMIGVTQSTVSKWERRQASPTLENLEKIRGEASSRRLELDDRLFFETNTEPVLLGGRT